MKSDYEYTLKGKQWELFELMQGDRNCAFTVSIRSGKTLMCFLYMVQECLSRPNVNVVYLAPTQTMLKNIFVREHVVKLQGTPYCEVTDGEVRFANGSRMIWLSAEKPERLRGLTVDVAVADECATMKPDVVTELINRTTATPGRKQGKVILITTPAGKNWYYDFIYGSDDEKGIINNSYWHYRKYDAYEMKVISEAAIDRLRETKDEVSYEQDVMCNFSEVKGRIFKNFSEKDHVGNSMYDKHKPLLVGADFNYGMMAWIIAQKKPDGGINIIDELALKYSSTEEACNELNNRYNYPAVIMFPDASGGQHTAAGGKSRTNFKIIKKILGDGVIKVGAKNPPVLDTINEVNEAFKNNLITINPKCKYLLKACLNYKWKEGMTNVPDKDDVNDHHADSLRYLIHNLYPIRREQQVGAPTHWNHVMK